MRLHHFFLISISPVATLAKSGFVKGIGCDVSAVGTCSGLVLPVSTDRLVVRSIAIAGSHCCDVKITETRLEKRADALVW